MEDPPVQDDLPGLERVRARFRRADCEGKGFIQRIQLTELVRRLMPGVPEGLARRLVAGDLPPGDELDYEHWLRWVFSGGQTADPTAAPSSSSSSRPAAAQPATSAATLRIVQVTDVYTLEEFPSLRNLIIDKRMELNEARGGGALSGSKTVSMLTGDFLMPYLLSTVDRGQGMMTMLNETPIDYLTWGNHEDDLGHADVMRCERQYRGVWINSNMTDHESFRESTCQKDFEVLEVRSADGSNVRKVGMVAVLSNEPMLYKPGAFGGATIEDPWVTLSKYKQLLERQHRCDLVVPLCHLYEPQDEKTAREFDFPVVLSGHDHHRVDRVVEGTRILKPGSDAHYAVILDITWDSAEDKEPRIEAETVRVADWKPDERLKALVRKSYAVLDRLRCTQLTIVPKDFRPLSSQGARCRRTTCSTLLCTAIRDALNLHCLRKAQHCDCVLINGGNFRGARDYADSEHLTLEALRSEMDEDVEIVVAQVPGNLLRRGPRETWGAPGGGWMQLDDAVQVDEDGYITHVDGKPVADSPRRLYRVGTTARFGIKLIPSVEAYFKADESRRPHLDTAVPVHALLMAIFAEQAWVKVWQRLDEDHDNKVSMANLRSLDKNDSGGLDKEEIMEGIKGLGFTTFKDEYALVDVIMHIAGDDDNDGHLSLEEMNSQRARRVREMYALKRSLGASMDKATELYGSSDDWEKCVG